MTKTVELRWERETRLIDNGGHVWATLRQCNLKDSPSFGYWSVQIGAVTLTNGYSHFFLETEDDARALAEKELR